MTGAYDIEIKKLYPMSLRQSHCRGKIKPINFSFYGKCYGEPRGGFRECSRQMTGKNWSGGGGVVIVKRGKSPPGRCSSQERKKECGQQRITGPAREDREDLTLPSADVEALRAAGRGCSGSGSAPRMPDTRWQSASLCESAARSSEYWRPT